MYRCLPSHPAACPHLGNDDAVQRHARGRAAAGAAASILLLLPGTVRGLACHPCKEAMAEGGVAERVARKAQGPHEGVVVDAPALARCGHGRACRRQRNAGSPERHAGSTSSAQESTCVSGTLLSTHVCTVAACVAWNAVARTWWALASGHSGHGSNHLGLGPRASQPRRPERERESIVVGNTPSYRVMHAYIARRWPSAPPH